MSIVIAISLSVQVTCDQWWWFIADGKKIGESKIIKTLTTLKAVETTSVANTKPMGTTETTTVHVSRVKFPLIVLL